MKTKKKQKKENGKTQNTHYYILRVREEKVKPTTNLSLKQINVG